MCTSIFCECCKQNIKKNESAAFTMVGAMMVLPDAIFCYKYMAILGKEKIRQYLFNNDSEVTGIIMTDFHPVWCTSVLDCPKTNIFSVVPYSMLQLVCNSSKKKLILQTLESKKCLFSPLEMMAFRYLPPPVEPW